MEYKIGTNYNGFVLVREENIKEVNSIARIFDLFGNGQDLDLNRCQPGGELSLGLLDQVGHEAVQGAQDGAVQDNGGLFGAVLVHIGQVELCGQAEVQLAGGQGQSPKPAPRRCQPWSARADPGA